MIGVAHARAPRPRPEGLAAGARPSPASRPGDLSLAVATRPVVSDVLRAPGRPLDAATRAFMEPRFGRDLAVVRVHTDARADAASASVGARAFTVGSEIVFRNGAYEPTSVAGRELLAHELAHTLQQEAPGSASYAGAERAAREAAGAALGGRAPAHPLHTGPRLARQEEEPIELPDQVVEIHETGWVDPDPRQRALTQAARNGLITLETLDQYAAELKRGGGLYGRLPWSDEEYLRYDQELQDRGDNTRELWEQLTLDVWNRYVLRQYALYREQRATDWETALRRMNTAAVLGQGVGWATVALATPFAAGEAVGAAGVSELATSTYVNAPQLFDSAMLYGGAAMTGASLGEHITQIRAQGLHWSDIPEFAGDLVPFGEGVAAQQPRTRGSSATSEPDPPPGATAPRGATTMPAAPDPPSASRPRIGPDVEVAPPAPRPRIDPDVDAEVEAAFAQASTEKVRGRARPRMPTGGGATKAVPTRQRPMLDQQDIARLPGETQRQAVARVREVIGQRIDDTPLKDAWEKAVGDVLKGRSIGQLSDAEMLDAYASAQPKFWDRVRADTPAKDWLDAHGFDVSSGAAKLRVTTSLPVEQVRVSLDHIAEKATNPRAALDGANLRLEFHDPNSWREIVQMRHPELRGP